jgi:hypothetical protein
MITCSLRTWFACLLAVISLTLASCSTAPYRYEPLHSVDATARAVEQQQGAFAVRAWVPDNEEAERLLGIPIYESGIQPVWLEIANSADVRARVILTSIDKDYFPPYEIAWMHRKQFSKQGWKDMERYLHANSLPRHIGPGQTVSGFIFTHASTGTKAFNLDIYSADEERAYEQFTFFIEVPGFVPDHREIDFRNLYEPGDIRDVDNKGLRAVLAEIPCCTSNHDGSAEGRPLQLFFVAHGRDMLRALLRAGWNETSYARDETYLAGADYLFDRPPDAIFRKGRDRKSERAELSLWLAPVRADGKPLWVGQFKNAIGRRYAIGELFLGVTLDPDTTDGRNFALQNFWYAQALQHWAWSDTGRMVPQDATAEDFHGNPWFARDAYRIVLWISGEPIDMADATPFEWGRHDRYRQRQQQQ